jgi:DNA-binding CsgD family transcriptional regulator
VDDRILELHSQGKTYAEIAKELGCTRSNISYRAIKLGLKPNKNQKPIDVDLLRKEVYCGISFSSFCKKHGHTLSAVSKVAKKHGISSLSTAHKKKELPDNELYKDYVVGVSLDALHIKHNVSVECIKRHLRNVDPKIHLRTMDEAKRCDELNDRDILYGLMDKYSLRQIAKRLNTRVGTVQAAVRRLGLTDRVRNQEVEISKEELYDLYVIRNLSLTQISDGYCGSPATLSRKLREFGITPKPAHGLPRPSKHPKLNDKEWMYNIYVVERKSMGWIAAIVGTTIGNISNHLRKHEIPVRTKHECYKDLRIKQSKRGVVKTLWGKFKISSKLEKQFLRSLPHVIQSVKREPITLSFEGMSYTPDFEVGNEYVEIKPRGWMEKAGVDRQKYLKQFVVAKNNNISIKYWDRGYYEPEPISDEDLYFISNWKLVFSSPTDVYDFYCRYGFRPLLWPKSSLLYGLKFVVPDQYKFDTTYNCSSPLQILKHFNPHLWYSSHKKENCIADAFVDGNRNVLKRAIETVWDYKRHVNIYALVNAIQRYFKDFSEPSVFKPWVARAVYDKLLPDGGVVFDPCIGWGGRLLGTIDRDIRYIGSDLNQNAVNCSRNISKFIGSALSYDPTLEAADASELDIPADADLIFTSPPYDDTENYRGLQNQCRDTAPIYENILSKAECTVALNVPIRHAEKVKSIASRHSLRLVDELMMKNKTKITRKSTHEPILVFKR